MGSTAILAVEVVAGGLGLALAAWRLAGARRVWDDARGRGLSRLASFGWAVSALVYSGWYWWQGRLEHMGPEEAGRVLRNAAAAHRLLRVTNIRCPLCDAEIANALTATSRGELAIRARASCPRCDFRLDACRHCEHFQLAQDGIGGQGDVTHGRCDAYRATQPVEQAYPQMAKQLMAMGYDTLNAPKRIMDSYIPLEECTRFDLNQKRLRRSKLPWLGQERTALIRLGQRYKV